MIILGFIMKFLDMDLLLFNFQEKVKPVWKDS